MGSLVSAALDRAEYLQESARLDCRTAAAGRVRGGGVSLGAAVAASPGSVTGLSFGRYSQTMAHHADQYGFFNGYPYAIINNIAHRMAAQPIRVARLLPRGERARKRFGVKSMELVPKHLHDVAGRLEVFPDHRITKAIDRPNAMMTRQHLLYSTFASQEITGFGYWWLFADEETGEDQIWPVPSHWIEPVHLKDRLFAYWRVLLPGTGEPIKVPTRQIVRFMHADPSDPFSALAPLQANARAVMTDFSIEMAQRMSFENGINPGLAIMVGKPPEFAGVPGDQMVLTTEQRNQITAAVRRQYRGVTRFDEPLILDALIKDVKQITTSPREMAYTESSLLARNRLTQGFSMNPIVLGEMEGVNYASSGVADHHVCRNVFAPRTEGASQTMSCGLPPYFSPGEAGLIVYQEPVVPSDPEMDMAKEYGDFDRGIRSRNDIRQKRGMTPIAKGDRALTAAGWVAVREDSDGDGKAGPRRTEKHGGPRPAAGGKEKPGRPWGWWWGGANVNDTVGRRLRLKYARQVKRAAARVDGLQASAEADFRAALLPVFARLGAQAAARLRDHLKGSAHASPSEAALVAVDRPAWEKELAAGLEPVLTQAALAGAVGEWALYREAAGRKSWALPGKLARAARDVAADVLARGYTRAVVDATVRAVRRAVRRAGAEGHAGTAQAEVAAAAVLVGRGAEKAAEAVARNEAAQTVNAGQQAVRVVLAKAGKVAVTEWVTEKDERVRPSHRRLHGVRVRPGKAFPVGGHHAYYPGDPGLPPKERCNCRCKTITIYVEE